jgi:hypothetical protein
MKPHIRMDAGALLEWTVEVWERTLPDGRQQQLMVARDVNGTVVAQYGRDGDQWWWDRSGWVESGTTDAGILQPPTEIQLADQELHTVPGVLDQSRGMEIIDQTDSDGAHVTRFDVGDMAWMGQQLGVIVASSYYEVRTSLDDPSLVLGTRLVLVTDTGEEYAMSDTTFTTLATMPAEDLDDVAFDLPESATTNADDLHFVEPAPDALPAGLRIDRHWEEFPGLFERLSVLGEGVTLDVYVYPSRGGFDPRAMTMQAARVGNTVNAIDTAAGPVTYLTTPDRADPVLVVWDDGRYYYEINTQVTLTNGQPTGTWDAATMIALVEALSGDQ